MIFTIFLSKVAFCRHESATAYRAFLTRTCILRPARRTLSATAYRAFMTRTISIAESIASAPLLPAFVPARSIACSMLSVVSIPFVTGTPVFIEAAAMPFADSFATMSK